MPRFGVKTLCTLSAALAFVFACSGSALARSVYVANQGTDTGTGSVSIIDTGTNAVTGEIALPTGSRPHAVAISPNGGSAYTTDAGGSVGYVEVIDTATRTRVATITIGGTAIPAGIAITPDGRRAYVANADNPGTVSVIDLGTNAVTNTISTGAAEPYSVAITPDGGRAYVAETDGHIGEVTVIDTATNAVTGHIPVSNRPAFMAIAPDGQHGYASGDSSVAIIDLNTNALSGSFTAGTILGGVTLLPDGAHGYVNDLSGPPSVFETAGGASSPIGLSPPADTVFGAATPDGGRVYMTGDDSNTVYPIDTATNTNSSPIAVGDIPVGIAVVPDQAPIAEFTASAAPPGKTARFDAGPSSDPDGSIARYDWDFGDGGSASNGGAQPSHIYAKAGSYTVELTLTDNEGTSTHQVFTGQTVLRNGSPRATASTSVTIAKPSVKIVKPRKNGRYKRRALRKISGTAFGSARIAKVQYGLARVVPRSVRTKSGKRKRVLRCRFANAKGRLAQRIGSCHKQPRLKAKGTSKWSAKLRKPLPRGIYALEARAIDSTGTRSKLVRIVFRLV